MSKIDEICGYLDELAQTASEYRMALREVFKTYKEHYTRINEVVVHEGRTDWQSFTSDEKKITQNMILLIGLLNKMCKVNLVIKSEEDNGMDKINKAGVRDVMEIQNTIMKDVT